MASRKNTVTIKVSKRLDSNDVWHFSGQVCNSSSILHTTSCGDKDHLTAGDVREELYVWIGKNLPASVKVID